MTRSEKLTLAGNSDTPLVALEVLCSDSCPDVVHAAISNPQLDSGTLERLAGHSNSKVLCGVALHPQSPIAVILHLASHTHSEVALAALERMARAEEASLRSRAAQDMRTPRPQIISLCHDSDFNVREAAVSTLAAIDGAAVQALTNALFNTAYGADPYDSNAPGDDTLSPAPVDQTIVAPAAEPDDFSLWWDEIDIRSGPGLFDVIEDAASDTAPDFDDAESTRDAADRAAELASRIMAEAGWREGREVLERILDRPNLGQTRVAIIREIKRGLCAEELELVVTVREYWAAHFSLRSRYALSWPDALRFIRGFDSYPDPVEATEMLNYIHECYKHNPEARNFRDFGSYFWHLLQEEYHGFHGSFQELPFRLQGGWG